MLIVKGNRSHNTAAFTTPYNFCQKKCCHSRATWAKGVAPFVTEGEEKASSWMLEEGKQNIKELSTLLKETATPVYVDR